MAGFYILKSQFVLIVSSQYLGRAWVNGYLLSDKNFDIRTVAAQIQRSD